jgi:GTP-binding protein
MWRHLVEGYLDTVTTLQGMFLLIDLRRGPEEEEFQLLELFASRGLGGICILTKSDKMPKHRRRIRYLEISKGLHEQFGVQSMMFSSKTGAGREALWLRTQKWFEPSEDTTEPVKS